jgi:hypothetical protein
MKTTMQELQRAVMKIFDEQELQFVQRSEHDFRSSFANRYSQGNPELHSFMLSDVYWGRRS